MPLSPNAAAPAASPSDPVRFVAGFSELAAGYDLVLCDVWGVLHDGVTAFAEASDALSRYREAGGRVVLVSNAPRPGGVVAAQLDGFAVPRSAYDTIVTSGDLTRRLIDERAGQTMFYLGPDRDLALLEGATSRRGTEEDADYVVCTGLLHDEAETVEDYRPLLTRLATRGLPLICANPDIVVERGGDLVPCAGALAALYEEVGGESLTAGKPHRPIYDAALEMGATLAGHALERSRVIGVGDAIRTDVAGARGAGIASLMVGRGIHAGEMGLSGAEPDASTALAWLLRQPVRPTFLTVDLRWR